METLGLVLGVINLLIGSVSLAAARSYHAYVRDVRRRESAAEPARAEATLPSVTLFVPCCGQEDGLQDNLTALIQQDYPRLQLCFVVERKDDAAVPVINAVSRGAPEKSQLVVAGPASRSGQKIHNLLSAMKTVSPSDVWAFTDSDGRPDSNWLTRLVRAAGEDGVGVASSYRFYLPEPASFATLMRSAWNASILTVLGDHDRNFAWGGSMAIRRQIFESARVEDAWQGALSDDFAITHAVRRHGLRVAFVPSCLVGSHGPIRFTGTHGLFTWCARQMAITRVYWPTLFRIAFASHLTFALFLVAGSIAALQGSWSASVLMVAVVGLSMWNSGSRTRAIAELAPQWSATLKRHFLAYVLLAPLTSFLTLASSLRGLASRRIEWRGKIYEMRSPNETIILKS